MEIDVECPRCGQGQSVTIDSVDTEVDCECDECGAALTVSVSVDVDVDLASTPPVEGECPECDESVGIEEIEEESGSETVTCDGCNAELEVTWSDWGRGEVVVEVVVSGDKDEEEEEDEEEVEEEEAEEEEEDTDEDEGDDEEEEEDDEDY